MTLQTFLGEIKQLNQQQKTKEQVLQSCRGLFEDKHPQLWAQFQRLMAARE